MDHTPWGELEPSDEESSEEEEEEESDEEKPDETGFFTPADRYLTGLMVGVQEVPKIKKSKDQIVFLTFSVWVNNITSFSTELQHQAGFVLSTLRFKYQVSCVSFSSFLHMHRQMT